MRDKHQLFSIFALTLSLDIPLLETLLCVVFEYENSNMSKNSPRTSVSTETEFISALQDDTVTYIILSTDIILYNNLVFNRDITLDLNGYKLASLTPGARVIDIICGNVTLTGKGSIVANGLGAAAVRIKGAITADNARYSSVLIDEDVTLYAPNYYGLFVTPNCQAAYGVEVNFRGSMIAYDGFCVNGSIRGKGEHVPHIRIADGARITVDENDGIAIYASGYADWEIGAAEIVGATGAGVRTGSLTFKGATIIATGPLTELGDWNEGMSSCGAAVQFDTTHNDDFTVKIDGGEYFSRQSYTFVEGGWAHAASSTQSVKLQNGNFSGAAGIFYGSAPHSAPHRLVSIVGGNFSGNINDYLSDEMRSEYNHSLRMYHISPKFVPVAHNPRAELMNAKTELKNLLATTEYYLSDDYTSKELGDLQTDVDKALALIRRTRKSAEKLLSANKEVSLEQVKTMTRRVAKSNAAIQKIEDELRTDILSTIAAARAIDPQDYSAYSYRILMESVQDADILLIQRQVTLVELYSVFCDVNMNLDLLDEPEEDEEPFILPLATVSAPEPAPLPASELPQLPDLSPVEPPIAPTPTPEIPSIHAIESKPDSVQVVEPEPEEPPLLSASELDTLESAQTTLDTISVLGALALAEASPVNERLLEARENLRTLLNAITVLNPSDYSMESYRNLHEMVMSASSLLSEPDNNLSVDLLVVTYQRVNSAYSSLIRKSEDPVARAYDEACSNLYMMLEVVKNLSLNDYDNNHAEQFGELQVAIAKANVDLRNPNVDLDEILHVMDEIQLATTGLKVNTFSPEPVTEAETVPSIPAIQTEVIPTAPTAEASQTNFVQPVIQEATIISEPEPVYTQPAPITQTVVEPATTSFIANSLDWSAMREVISDIAALNAADYTPESYNHLLDQLEYTKTIFGDPRITQDFIDDVVFELNLSVLSLERINVAAPSSVYENTQTPQPVSPAPITDLSQSAANVTPNLLMSMMAGAYAGIATYRRSRIEAKQRK